MRARSRGEGGRWPPYQTTCDADDLIGRKRLVQRVSNDGLDVREGRRRFPTSKYGAGWRRGSGIGTKGLSAMDSSDMDQIDLEDGGKSFAERHGFRGGGEISPS